MAKRQYVSEGAPTQSTYTMLRRIIWQLPTQWPYVRSLRAILNSDVHEYMRKNDPDGPERALIGDVVLFIDEKVPRADRVKPYIREIQKCIIEYMDVMKQHDLTVIDLSQLRHGGLDLGRNVRVTPDTDGEIEIDLTRRPGEGKR